MSNPVPIRHHDLGPYHALATLLRGRACSAPPQPPSERRASLARCLRFDFPVPQDLGVRVEQAWTADGVDGSVVTWDLGYGPRTEAWLLRPAGDAGALPGVLALHDHGGFKTHGKAKIADGPDGPAPEVGPLRDGCYDGVAWANELARSGFAVLVHDVFTWGSRRMPFDRMLGFDQTLGRACTSHGMGHPTIDPDTNVYNFASLQNEHALEKYGRVLGFSLSGVVHHEDRVALEVLRSWPGVGPAVGCIGLSGGGCRSVLLQGQSDGIRAAVVVGMMSTYEGLLDRHMSHSWMLFPPGWTRYGDWPDAAGCRAPSPLLVQYDLDDELFTEAGMRDAHRRLTELYREADAPAAYRGEFYPGPHKFDRPMQAAATRWLRDQLAAPSPSRVTRSAREGYFTVEA